MNVIDPIPAGNQKNFFSICIKDIHLLKRTSKQETNKLNLIELLTPSLFQVNSFYFIIKLMQIQNMRIEMMLPYY